MSSTATYTVVGMTCGHCVSAVTEEVTQVPGVTGVDVDLASGALTVTGETPVDDGAVRAAVEEAGYAVDGDKVAGDKVAGDKAAGA